MFPVHRFVLPSGMRVVHAPDHAAPIVSYQTWYGVGSRHEQPGKTGMAHLFEHLMFNRTESLAAGELDRLIEQTGGDTNAATWVDWTYYSTTVPARDLELAVRLESDRMQHLVLDDDVLEAERDVVINERLQRVEDDVEGFMDEQLFATAFVDHPYRWPTIGWMADIESLSKQDINEFYRGFYAPNNATIVVAGDVTADRLRQLIDRYYADIEPVALPAEDISAEPAQPSERRLTITKPVTADRAVFAYKIPGQAHPDWAVLEFISSLLCGGPSARLYRRLHVELELTTTVDASATPFRDPGLLELWVNMTRGNDAAAAAAVIDQLIAELATTPIPDSELTKVKNLVETDLWTELSTVDGRAEALGHYEVTQGYFGALFDMAARLSDITADDVMRVANTYLHDTQRTVIVARPEAPELGDK